MLLVSTTIPCTKSMGSRFPKSKTDRILIVNQSVLLSVVPSHYMLHRDVFIAFSSTVLVHNGPQFEEIGKWSSPPPRRWPEGFVNLFQFLREKKMSRIRIANGGPGRRSELRERVACDAERRIIEEKIWVRTERKQERQPWVSHQSQKGE